uniref:Small monomeric GTPase n=1 Tax=Ciona intestinalis TaxID=7719 RepID=H2XUB9_CIOIN
MGKSPPSYKVLVVGSKNVGKYSLCQQFVKGWIAEKPGDDGPMKKTVQINNTKVELEVIIHDVEGKEEIGKCDGVILVYSIIDAASLTFVKSIAFQKLHVALGSRSNADPGNDKTEDGETTKLRQADEGSTKGVEMPTLHPEQVSLSVPVVLVGTKEDEAKLSRQVDLSDAETLSQELSCVGFFETAAPCNSNVAKAFECVAEDIVNKRANTVTPETKSGCCIVL